MKSAMNSPEGQDPEARENGMQIDRQIVDNLRRAYEQTARQEIPDRFHELLRQLRDAEAADDRGAGGGMGGSGAGGEGAAGGNFDIRGAE